MIKMFEDNLLKFLDESEAVFVGVFSLSGDMRYCNKALKELFNKNIQTNCYADVFVNPTFNEVINKFNSKNDFFKGYITLKKRKKNDTFSGIILKDNDRILFYAEPDLRNLDSVMERIIELNSALNNKNRLILKQKEEIKLLSITDPLTGIANRTYILDRLSEYMNLSNRYERKLSISFIDLDKLKYVNDKFGHKFGDKVLIEFSCLVRDRIRVNDLIGRYGGDEFLLIMPELDISNTFSAVNDILNSVRHLKFDFSNDFQLTFSAGISQYKGNSIDEFIEEADSYAYVAKERGRNCICY